MAVTSKMLLDLAGSRQIYDRGVHIFNTGQVKITSTSTFWKNQVKVKACANDDNETTKNVTMEFGSGRILSSRCSCMYQDMQHRGYLCAHAVAAALAYLDLQDSTRKDSDPQALSMIRSYGRIRTNQVVTDFTIRQDENYEPVGLQPVLSFNGEQLAVGFRIGKARYYKVQNIPELVKCYQNGDKCCFGKNLDFYCVPEAFDGESRELLDVLLTIIGHIPDGLIAKNVRRSSLSKDQSMLLPVDEDLDLLFGAIHDPLLEADGIPVPGGCLRLTDEDPHFKIYMNPRSAGNPKLGMNLVMPGKLLCLSGLRHDYIVMGEKLCRTSEEYHRNMGPFLEAVSAQEEEQETRIRLSAEDMPAFCINVLPFLRKYARVECDEKMIAYYEAENLKAEFLFDLAGEMEITMEIRYCYGDKIFNPVAERTVDYKGRDQAKEKEIALLAARYFKHRYMSRNLLTTHEDAEDALRLLNGGIEKFALYGEVKLSQRLAALDIRRPGFLTVNVNPKEDWLDLQVDLDGMEPNELLQILNQYEEKKNYYHLKDGSLVLLKSGQLDLLNQLMDGLSLNGRDLTEGRGHIEKNRAFFIRRMVDEYSASAKVNEWLTAMTDSLLDKKNLEKQEQIPECLQGVLRKYQEDGYQWLCALDRMGFGGILADDMGLGKTIQMIALIRHIYEDQEMKKPTLIVCPSSLIYNWQKEITRFAPDLTVSLIIGSGKERKELLRNRPESLVWITSYDLLRRDIEEYDSYEFRLQVLDEAQYIKNQGTQNAKAVKKIHSVRRFALTGTPVENRLGELWSIFDFLMPGFLNSYHRFRSQYEQPIVKNHEEMSLKRLLMMISPFILRRMKKEVLPELPDKCEFTVNPVLTGEQKKLYNAQALKLKRQLAHETEESFNRNRTNILADLMKLREICCAPSLVFEDFKGENAKTEALMELVRTCAAGGHRMLIFSQFARMIHMIGEMLKEEGIEYITLTGQTSKVDRDALVDRFANENIPVFLISLKAGGTGLNLTQADTVIHFDPWWNVAAQNQATDRAYRIGQTKEVNVYRLIAAGTIEENILNLQNAKQDLADQVLAGRNTGLAGLSREELMELL